MMIRSSVVGISIGFLPKSKSIDKTINSKIYLLTFPFRKPIFARGSTFP